MILLKDLTEDTLRLFASRGYDPTGVGAEVAFGEGVIGVVAERKRMMRVGSLGAGIAYITSIRARLEAAGEVADRKSTRLNSSHTVISYAVFCLKKKRSRISLI